MAEYTFTIYQWSPYDYFLTVPGTFTLTADVTDTGTVVVTDNETGVDGLTLDDDVGNSQETATGDFYLTSGNYFGIDLNADAGWTLYDPVDDVTFQVILLNGKEGKINIVSTLSEYPLVEGRTYQVIQFDNQPLATNPGDPVFTYSDYVCFTEGCRVRTPDGWARVEMLQPGDLVITRDHGAQPVRWIGKRTVEVSPDDPAITFEEGAFGARRAFTVSPLHRMLIESGFAEMLFGEREVLVRARDLLGQDGVSAATDKSVTYIHLLFDRHELVNCEGAWSESLHPGEQCMLRLGRLEALCLRKAVPALRNGIDGYGPTSRTALKAYEAALLFPQVEFAALPAARMARAA